MADIRKMPRYQTFNGILFPAGFPTKNLKEVFEYKPQPDDNFIITYPKSGTTWMQNVVISVFRKGRPLEDGKMFNTLSPFFDMAGLDGLQKMPRPGSIKSHLPYNHMPYSPDAKYIFVARNPRDVCVSLYYHTKSIPIADYQDATFDDFFELFMDGLVEYNDYFDHLLSWYPHRHDKNIWYTTYEQMKVDPKTVICSVAKFLGEEYSVAIENDNAVMNSILNITSFEYMKSTLKQFERMPKKRDQLLHESNGHENEKQIEDRQLPEKVPKRDFFRKGIVGDWRNHFSGEQIKRLDEKFTEKTQGTDIGSWWSY